MKNRSSVFVFFYVSQRYDTPLIATITTTSTATFFTLAPVTTIIVTTTTQQHHQHHACNSLSHALSLSPSHTATLVPRTHTSSPRKTHQDAITPDTSIDIISGELEDPTQEEEMAREGHGSC